MTKTLRVSGSWSRAQDSPSLCRPWRTKAGGGAVAAAGSGTRLPFRPLSGAGGGPGAGPADDGRGFSVNPRSP